MVHKFSFFLLCSIFSLGLNIEYSEALDILNNIKKQKDIPDSRIDNAIITMSDRDYVTAKIKCDTLIKYDRNTLGR